MIPLPYRILAAVLAGLGLFLAGFFFGESSQRNAELAKAGKALEMAVEKHDVAAAVGQAVGRESAVRAAKTEAVFNGIQQGVVTYAKNHPAVDCSLDADGLFLWRAANDGADADSASAGVGGVPAAAAAGERQPDRPAGESRGGGEGLPPVPGPAPGADPLAGEND